MRRTVSEHRTIPAQQATRKCVMLTDNTALSTGDHESPLSVCDFVRTVKSCQSNHTRTVLLTPHLGLTLRRPPS
jgi:hypothetical protein